MSTSAVIATRPLTLGDALAGARLRGAWRDVVLVAAGAALTAGAAQLAFSVPWTSVPYTLQTGAVLLVGTALGARRGIAAMGLYLLAGAIGAPVFAGHAAGVEKLLGFTGGYLVGFVLAAALVGRLAERRWDRTSLGSIGLMLAGNLVIYAVGVPVLAVATGMGAGDALSQGALVFLPWDAAKVLLAAGLLPLTWRLVGEDPARGRQA